MTEQSLPEESIFLQAMEIDDAAERVEFVARACGSDARLREGVEALLRASAQSGDLLDVPDPPGKTMEFPAADDEARTCIGPYKLLQQIGEGGMGVVYMAEQTEPVARRVALKIIKPGMDSRQVIARFEAERQALAMMDHPNIAKVLDAGEVRSAECEVRSAESAFKSASTPHSTLRSPHWEGRPYFVMELVKGVPITRFCDEQQLTLKQRLELFVPVCQAIQHAHQKGIIHRDIKPSNILVAQYDGVPVPKVIDFGVAKATAQKLTEKTIFTQFGQLVGTLEYMSPEQAQFNQLDIDTRSDIYSLGVLLYELLTGTTPFDQSRFCTVPFDETLRIIREEEPPKPSTRLSSSDTLPTIAAKRGVEPARLRKMVRGELDWIVMKALEKDRNRRYETASGLARDIERYLHDEPVQARTPSISYRLSKFIRRNRWRLVTGALLGLALLITAGSVAWMLRSSSLRRYRLETEFAAALNEAASLRDQGDWPKSRARLDQAERVFSGNVRATKGEQLRVMRSDLEMLARMEDLQLRISPFADETERLSLGVEADAAYARAFERFGVDVSHPDPETTANSIRQSEIRLHLVAGLDDWMSITRLESLRYKQLRLVANLADPNEQCRQIRSAAEQGDQQTLLEMASRPEMSDLPLSTLLLLARALDSANPQRAKASIAVLYMTQRRFPGNFPVNVLLARRLSLDKPDQAAGFMRVAIATRPNNPVLWYYLGTMLHRAKHFDQAAEAIRQSIALDPRKHYAHSGLGRALESGGRWAEAITAYSEAQRLYASAERSPSTPSYPDTLLASSLLRRAECYGHLGRWQNAISDCSQAIEADPDRSAAWIGRSRCWMLLGDWTKAAQDAARAVERQPDDLNLHFVLAACLVLSGDGGAYRQACAEALMRSTPVRDNYAHYITARAYILSPEGGVLPALLLSRVERVAEATGSGGWLHVRAMAHYWAKQYPEAKARLDEARKIDPAWDDKTCLNTLLYALVHLRLGDEAAGRKYLERAKERLSQGESEKGASHTFPVHIANWLSCQILLRDVEASLQEEAGPKKQEGREKSMEP